MVEAFLKILRRETSGLHEAAFLLGFFALLSQVFALVRDKLLASQFGASADLDLYYAAFRIPDFLFVTLGSVVSLSVLIPFIERETLRGLPNVRRFIDSIFTVFLASIIAIGAIIFIFSPTITSHLFPGFSVESNSVVSLMTRILLLSPVLLGISNLFGSLAQANNRFLVYALSPLLYNFGIILGVIFLYKPFGLYGLAIGVIFGAMLHLLIQVPTILRLHLAPRITFKPDLALIKEIAYLALPRTIALSVSHIAIFVLVSFATLMAEGSITVFNFAWNLQSVPLSIFGVSYSLAAFPALSRLYISGEKDAFLAKFIASAKHIIFWIIPCTALFIVLRAHIVRIVLGSGEFDWTDTRLTAAVLALFAFSLVFQAMVLLCIRGLYAMGSTGKPFYITIISGFSIIAFSFLFWKLFEQIPSFKYFVEAIMKIPDITGSSVATLALGFSSGSFLEAVLMWIYFTKIWKGASTLLARSFVQVVSSSVILGFVSYLSLKFFGQYITLDTFWGVFSQTVISAFLGVTAWIAALTLLKNKELPIIAGTLKERFWRTKPTSPDTSLV
ncbi:MAG: hypothetical protein A2741_00765 [Candidatus Zambryskibacteria bacterium RIFCSPHIGHO2_01_FULL_43_27]|uniref:Lipid II flippase MurJ n=1 Tax=Candidatus Zambryskibacteria bacterium RIFCSPLOWO2_01_FULL_43_17 TaxID=1802760 RepID=A0A1G2U2P1_9BACT|nr:MAG: hypothetical protein A2741_00765 [Candidatus Zambryskibacteria bacterium RIFCSPHIGHO2_01_FULL_43_27]OHB00606.1 MAG: hypothetical protein A3E93_03250 [Candidatus Zambryskibacteria bacterium RIFCSPHIGHO2_12_FULL_43_12b]OHB03797.1 MAG: hypothetical protein A2920_01985 [Candidatus Zambryskibacteria bacterium RIFCSPLOWO2_01_FULL_43_17]